MATPYARPSTDTLVPGPRFVRPREGRVLGGVCIGLGEHLGVPVRVVRIVVVVLTVLGGSGAVAYAFLWALAPAESAGMVGVPAARAYAGAVPPARPVTEETTARDRSAALLVLGAFVAAAGGLLALQRSGVDVHAGTLVPLVAIVGGALLAWSQLGEAQRTRWVAGSVGDRRMGVARVVAGLLLSVVGIVVLVTRGRSLAALWDAGLATLAVLAGAALVATPWIVRMWGDLRAEQVAAARATERADIAAHLHDSVLQTLALIQRRADNPTAVAQLARAQERELRSWLYDAPSGEGDSLGASLTAVAHDVEDDNGVPVDLVVTGDRPMNGSGTALVRAFREAVLNAVRHGSPPVTAYAEIGPSGVEVYVRDHGPGFSLDDVPPDRLGVRESILGRMDRAGGSARIRRLDQGTEVALTLAPSEGAPS